MIKVFSREDIEEFYKNNPEDSTHIISINDVGYSSPVPETHQNCLRLWFDDVTPFLVEHHLCFKYYEEEFLKRKPVLFTDAMAGDTSIFIHNWMDCCNKCGEDLPLYIHCYAGVSRSASIAIFAHMLAYSAFNNVEIEGIDFSNCRMNTHVFGLLYKTTLN